MNGNANLNANNLTPQNVVDWQNKLGIGNGYITPQKELLNQNITSLPEVTFDGSIYDYDFLIIYGIIRDTQRMGGALYLPQFCRQNCSSYNNRLAISNDSEWIALYFPADNKIKVSGHSTNAKWLVVRGIKLTNRTN